MWWHSKKRFLWNFIFYTCAQKLWKDKRKTPCCLYCEHKSVDCLKNSETQCILWHHIFIGMFSCCESPLSNVNTIQLSFLVEASPWVSSTESFWDKMLTITKCQYSLNEEESLDGFCGTKIALRSVSYFLLCHSTRINCEKSIGLKLKLQLCQL